MPRSAKSGPSDHRFSGPQTAKHLIESLGIPHTEVGTVWAHEHEVGLGYLVQDGDQLEIRTVMPEIDSAEEPRFVLDGHLGRLTSRLRMLGLDCEYHNDYTDPQLAELALSEGRVLLTRDRRLLMRKTIVRGYLIRSLDAEAQGREVIRRFGLKRWLKPFRRCIRCNHDLEPVEKERVLDRLQPLTRRYFDSFYVCPACRQIYWKGSHVDKMQALIADLLNSP